MSIWDEAKLVNIASGYKAATYYSVLPEDGSGDFDVARNSVATRVNSDLELEEMAAHVPRIQYDSGVTCPYCLLEPQTTNLLTYPVSFGNPYWTKSGAAILGDETNKTTIYSSDFSADVDGMSSTRVTSSGNNDAISDGATSYDDVLKTYASVDNATHYVSRAGMITTNVIQKISWKMYIPSANTNVDDLRITNGGTTFHHLQSSVKKVIDGTDLGAYATGSGYITGTEGFWVEVILWVEEQSAAGTHIRWQHAKNVGDSFAGAGSSADDIIYFRDILVEDVGGYSAPHADSPLDVSAFKLVEDSATSTHYIQRSLTVTNGVAVTCSFIAKADERTWIRFEETAAADGYYFDLTNGVIGTAIGTVDAYSIVTLADSWFRITITVTVPSTTAVFKAGLCDADNSNSYAGDGSSGAYIAFAQVEEQDYPTSFAYSIAGGEGSTTTRIADLVDGAGTSATFNSEEGVLYRESAALFDDEATDRYLSLSDGTVNNAVQLYYSSTTQQIVGKVIVGGVTQDTLVHTVTDETAFAKSAIAWEDGAYSLYVAGVEEDTGTGDTFAADVLTTMQADDGAGANPSLSKDREWDVFELLTAAQLTELTT